MNVRKAVGFDRRMILVLVALGLGLVGLTLLSTLAGLRPPEPAVTQVGMNGPVGLRFAQKMQPDGVESRWHSQPALAGRFAWDGLTLWFWPAAALDVGQEYHFWLEEGALSVDGQVQRRRLDWSVRVRQPQVVYLSPAMVGSEIWLNSLNSSGAIQLSHTDHQVLDFNVLASGEWIAFTVRNSAQGSDLWVTRRDGSETRRIVDCGGDRCNQPAWSPDGKWLAYSRRRLAVVKGEDYSPLPRLWTVDLTTGKTAALFQDATVGGMEPQWSPDGRRLAFFDAPGKVIHVLEIETGKQWMLPSRLGAALTWTSNSQQLWYGDLETSETLPYGSAYRADVGSGQVEPLFGTLVDPEDFGSPVPTPDGAWVAVGVRVRGGSHSVQLQLMRPDGGERQAITHDFLYTHGAYHWNPNGDELLYQRVEIASSAARPEVWLWNRLDGTARRIAANCALPAWLP